MVVCAKVDFTAIHFQLPCMGALAEQYSCERLRATACVCCLFVLFLFMHCMCVCLTIKKKVPDERNGKHDKRYRRYFHVSSTEQAQRKQNTTWVRGPFHQSVSQSVCHNEKKFARRMASTTSDTGDTSRKQQQAQRKENGPYASLAAMFSNRVRHFDCVINRGC